MMLSSMDAGILLKRMIAIFAFFCALFMAVRAPSDAFGAVSLGDRIRALDSIKVRGTAGLSGILLGTRPAGTLGYVVGGPVASDGFLWWKIDYDGAPDGWSAGNWLITIASPSVAVVSPNGGGVWQMGTVQTVFWSVKNPPPNSRVALSLSRMISPLVSGLPNYYIYRSVTVPTSTCIGGTICLPLPAGNDYRLKVDLYFGDSCTYACPPGTSQPVVIASDQSDAPFTLLASPPPGGATPVPAVSQQPTIVPTATPSPTPVPPPPAGPATAPLHIDLYAEPASVFPGMATALRWNVTGGGITCTASGGWSGVKPASGVQVIDPIFTAEYSLACSNSFGEDSLTVTVTVKSLPEITVLSPNGGEELTAGGTFSIRWFATNLDAVNIFALGPIQPCTTSVCPATPIINTPPISLAANTPNDGSFDWVVGKEAGGNPMPIGEYFVSVAGTGQFSSISDRSNVAFRTKEAPLAPTADLKINDSDGPVSVFSGGRLVISWTSTNAQFCTILPFGWGGTSGSQETFNLRTEFTVECTAPGGIARDTVNVTITLPPVDINGDSKVDVADLIILIGKWGATTNSGGADLNGDGKVDVIDIVKLLTSWTGTGAGS